MKERSIKNKEGNLYLINRKFSTRGVVWLNDFESEHILQRFVRGQYCSG